MVCVGSVAYFHVIPIGTPPCGTQQLPMEFSYSRICTYPKVTHLEEAGVVFFVKHDGRTMVVALELAGRRTEVAVNEGALARFRGAGATLVDAV